MTPLGQAQGHNPNEAPTSMQAVIFDVDGTLAETELNGHRVAFNRAFRECGVGWDWSPDLYGELLAVTGGKERIRLYAELHARELLARPDFDAWVASLHQRKTEIYSELALVGSIALRPGVARLIDELRAADIRLAVATTTTRACLDSLITASFGCATSVLFDVVGAGDQVAEKKPAPDIYHWVLRKLGLPASACLAIEDSLPGLRAALGAGLPTLVTLNDYTVDDDFTGALTVLSDLGEPSKPSRYINGLPLAGTCVDLAQLRAWHYCAVAGKAA